MGKLALSHGIGQGVNIEGGDISIDLIVRAIGGRPPCKFARFEVRGVDEVDEVILDQSTQNCFSPADGVEVFSHRVQKGGQQIKIVYNCDLKYNISRPDYSD